MGVKVRTGEGGAYLFFCPGCKEAHIVYTGRRGAPNWDFNDDLERPTFSPSILLRTGRAVDPAFVPEEGDPPEICHSFVRDGKIQFLRDCKHDLAGQTVDLPDIDKWWD